MRQANLEGMMVSVKEICWNLQRTVSTCVRLVQVYCLCCADMGPRATGKEAVPSVVVDKMRRRMRQNGYHAHITLQVHSGLLTFICARAMLLICRICMGNQNLLQRDPT